MTKQAAIPQPLSDVPATAKIVYLCLDRQDRPLSTAEIAATMRIPERSVRSGLNDLDDEGLIATDGNPVSPAYRLTGSA